MPLTADQAAQFGGGAVWADVSEANGDKAGIPQPLVRVNAGRRARPTTEIVTVEDSGGASF